MERLFQFCFACCALSLNWATPVVAQNGPGVLSDASPEQVRFCVVPVKDGAPTPADIGQTWRITDTNFRIPGLPALIFTPENRGGQWTIDPHRRLIPYVGPFPHSYLDQNSWISEPWSGRVVAFTYDDGALSVLRPGTGRFEALERGDRQYLGRYRSIQVLPSRKLTVVVSSAAMPFVVEDASLRPWLSPAEMKVHGLRGIRRVYDVPLLSAMIILDIDGGIHIVTENDHWQQIGSVAADMAGSVFEMPDLNAVAFMAATSVLLISQDSGKPDRFSVKTFSTTEANSSQQYLQSKLFKQILTYNRGHLGFGARWQRFGRDGLEDIPGGDIGIATMSTFPYGRIHDLPTIGKTVIEGRKGLYLYDGHALTPVLYEGVDRIGPLPDFFDLPSINRAIVSTKNGMFELTADGKLVSRPMPFSTQGWQTPSLADWSEPNVALASTRNGLFTLDADLRAKPVLGAKNFKPHLLKFANGTNPATGEMVLSDVSGVLLTVDSRKDPDACRGDRGVLESR